MREKFLEQLEKVNVNVQELLARDTEAVEKLVEDIKTGSVELLKNVETFEDESHQLNRTAEHAVMMLLLRQQPVADDLHALTSSLAIFRNLVRIAIQATECHKLWIQLPKEDRKYPLLEKQGGLVVEMAKTLQIGVETRSVDVLRKITEQDDLVDEVFLEVKEKIVTDIQEKTINASVAVDLLLMGKYFEKMGDHLSSIARHQLRLIERKW